MTRGINFVHERQKRLDVTQRKDRYSFRVSGIVGSVCLLLFLVAVGVRLWLVSQVAQALADQETYQQQVLDQEEAEKSYLVFANKLKLLNKLFQERRDKQEAIGHFSTLFGPEIKVTSIEYTALEGKLSFSLQAQDVFNLETAMAVLSSPETLDRYQSLQKSGLRRLNTGAYDLQVAVVLKSHASVQPAAAADSAPNTGEGAVPAPE